tara:strand:- start:152 stop:658 length:507 start_codon:yes stop_codon:yes gene_type:complete
VAKYKPGKSGVASRKIRELKKDIKSESDKDRIKKLEEQLAILMAMRNQDMEGGKSVSDADIRRMRARTYDNAPPLRDRIRMEDLNFKRNLPGATPTRKKGGGKVHGEKKKKDMKHGGKAHNENMMYGGGAGMMKKKKKNGMMGGGKAYASMNKRYANGGKIYPRKGNI